MIIINTKNYLNCKETLALAKKIQKINPKIILSVPAFCINEIKKTKIQTFAQHIDSEEGRATGFLLPKIAKSTGATGTLLNHSEHQIPLKKIKETIPKLKEENLKIILCASSIKQARTFIPLNPTAIAFEDKKLIGTGKSITQYRTRKVKKFAKLLSKTKIKSLCGAGINSTKDIKKAKELGCDGVLIASAIAKNPNSKKTENFLKGISKL